MPYQPVPFFNRFVPDAEDGPRHAPAPAPAPRLRRRALAAAVAVTTLALLGAGAALAAPTSSRLSAQGWRTFSAVQALDASAIDPSADPDARAKLQHILARCRRLPGHGAQSTGIRKICLGEVRVVDHLLGAMQCADAAGGGDEAQGLCFIAALPALDRDLDVAARGSGAVVATLRPGRCRRAFAREQRVTSTAAARGRDLLAAIRAQDVQAAQRADDRWTKAFEKALKPSFGSGNAGCRPRVS